MIKGCDEPRIFTPPLRELTPETSDGFAVIAFAHDVLRVRLFGWQKWALIHGMEKDHVGFYRFRVVIVEVARQNGKTLLMVILALWHIYCRDSRTVIGTAQDLANAERAWAEAVELAQSEKELDALIERITLAHPKVLRLITGCEYRVASASRRGGRGFSGDLVLLDELREHTSWDSWAAVSNTMNARPHAQAWCFSNAGDAASVVLRYQRAAAHQALGWPDGDGDKDVLGDATDLDEDPGQDIMLGWFEWSAPPGARRDDVAALAQANPSKDHVEVTEHCVTERALRAALRTSPPQIVETEVLCRWLSTSDSGPFLPGTWVASTDPNARPATGAKSVVCVEIAPYRSRTRIGRAALDEQGRVVAGIWCDQANTDWVPRYLVEHRADYELIVIRGGTGSSAMSLIEALQLHDLPVIKWVGVDFGAAHGQLFDRLRDKTFRHLPHPDLDAAATSAAIQLLSGGAWVLDQHKSPTDVTPLWAVMGATWGLAHLPAEVEVEVWGLLI